jgi:hypothetical protein
VQSALASPLAQYVRQAIFFLKEAVFQIVQRKNFQMCCLVFAQLALASVQFVEVQAPAMHVARVMLFKRENV